MRKNTRVDQIDITSNGTINLRIAKEIIDDDGAILQREWHRTTLPPGVDLDDQIGAVNLNLTNDLNMPALAGDDHQLAILRRVVPMVHTEDVLLAYAEALASRVTV